MIEATSDYAKIKELSEEQRRLNALYEEDIARWSELEEQKNNEGFITWSQLYRIILAMTHTVLVKKKSYQKY